MDTAKLIQMLDTSINNLQAVISELELQGGLIMTTKQRLDAIEKRLDALEAPKVSGDTPFLGDETGPVKPPVVDPVPAHVITSADIYYAAIYGKTGAGSPESFALIVKAHTPGLQGAPDDLPAMDDWSKPDNPSYDIAAAFRGDFPELFK